MKKIRRRNGADAMVDDDYILQDGEGFVIPLSMFDSKPVMITDSRGNPAGQRPGFLFTNDAAERALDDAHLQYRTDIEARWMSDRWSGPSKSVPRSTGSQTFDSPQAAVDAAYRQYAADISERWRK